MMDAKGLSKAFYPAMGYRDTVTQSGAAHFFTRNQRIQEIHFGEFFIFQILAQQFSDCLQGFLFAFDVAFTTDAFGRKEF